MAAWTENEDYSAFIRRSLNALVKRVDEPADLRELLAIRQLLDEKTFDAVAHLRSARGGSYSWQEIAVQIGVTRQAAAKRWAGAGGARQVGGQPGWLR